MVMRVLILTGGTVEENFAKDYISKWNPDQVITADKGLLYAKRLNIKPDIILGDFDSCSKDIMQEFSTDKKIIVPCEKDDTDTGLAIQKAIYPRQRCPARSSPPTAGRRWLPGAAASQ